MRKVIMGGLIILSTTITNSLVFANEGVMNHNEDFDKKKDIYEVVENYSITSENVFSYVDPERLYKNNESNGYSLSADRATYSHTNYEVESYDLLVFDALPKTNETFLISIPEGMTVNLESTKTVTGTISLSGGLGNDGEKTSVSKKIGLTASGTISRTWKKGLKFEFPKSYEGIYRTANFYGAVSFNYYNVHMKKYDVYLVETGNTVHPQKRNESSYNVYAYIPKYYFIQKGQTIDDGSKKIRSVFGEIVINIIICFILYCYDAEFCT